MFPFQTIFFTFILHFTISSLTKVNIISWDSKFRYTRMDIDFHLIGNNNEHCIKNKLYEKVLSELFFCSVFVIIRNYTKLYAENTIEALKYLNKDKMYIRNVIGDILIVGRRHLKQKLLRKMCWCYKIITRCI